MKITSTIGKLPDWAACFLLTAIVVGLQVIPITGVFLMLLAAPYWSVILINLGFGLMLRDAWLNPARRWLFIPPLLWFFGYFIAASISNWQAANFVTEIELANEGKRVVFDPVQHDILIEPDSRDENNGSALRARTLIGDYGVTSAFERTTDFRGNVRNRSLALVNMICPSRTLVKNFDGSTTQFGRVNASVGQRTTTARDLCTVFGSLLPERPTVRVRPQPQVTDTSNRSATQDINIESADGRMVTLRSGWVRPLSWLPQPVIGCGLNSASPAWECIAAFERQSLYDPDNDRMPVSAEKVVAQALGLRKQSLRERYPNADWYPQ